MHPPDPDDASREPATSPMICSNRKIAAKKMVVGEATASPRARCSPGRPAVRSLLAAMVSPTALPLLITILASSSLGPSYGAPQYIRDIVAQEEEYLRNRHHQHHRKKRHHQHHLRHNHQHLSNKRQKREQATPPIANRIESRVTYAGSAPPGWDPKIPRQSSNSKNKLIDPPVPIPDPYGWLRDDDRSNETVLQYLKAENAYTASVTDHLKSLQDEIYNEMLSSLKETDYSMPRPWGKYWYYSRTYEGSSYGAFCRAPIANWEESGGATIEARGSKSSSGGRSSDQHPTIDWDGSKDSPILPGEEVYLDVNDLAKGKAYCDVGSVSTSPSHDYVAYTVDYTGGEKRELHVRDLRTGRDVALLKSRKRSGIAKIETIAVADATAGSSGSTSEHLQENDELLTIDGFEWGKDDNTLYYTTTDDSQRAYRLYVRYNWKSESNFTDEQLKEENDVLFSVSVGKSFDERYLFYSSSSEETSEVWYLNLTSPKGFECVAPRRENVIYDVESHVDRSHGDRWYITTNVGGHHSDNFKLMSSPATYNCSDQWTLVLDDKGTTLFDGDPNTTRSIDGITAFSTHAIIEGREDGIPQLWMYSFANNALVRLDFEDDAYDVGLATNYEVGATRVALFYTSMIDPGSTIEVSFDDGGRQRTILKMDEVPGYDRELYGTERVHVPSRDGKTNIPVSLVYLKEAKEKAKAEAKGVEDDESGGPRVHLYGYGAYGMAMEADFSSSVLPLLKVSVRGWRLLTTHLHLSLNAYVSLYLLPLPSYSVALSTL